MKKNGRYSRAELSIVPFAELPRPEPPTNLSEPAKQIWQATVAAFRSDWFSGCSPVLIACCETAVGERQVARILAECSPQDERWPEIIKLYCSVTSSLSSLGTRLRITPQSRRDGRDATLIRCRAAGSLGRTRTASPTIRQPRHSSIAAPAPPPQETRTGQKAALPPFF